MSLPPPSYGDRLISGLAVHVNFQPVLSIRKLDLRSFALHRGAAQQRQSPVAPMPAQGREREKGLGGCLQMGARSLMTSDGRKGPSIRWA